MKFRTGFTGKDSFVVAQNAISDYENTRVDQMRKHTSTFHGTQPGDPSKLAAVIVKLGIQKIHRFIYPLEQIQSIIITYT
jgi:hypothetical protein